MKKLLICLVLGFVILMLSNIDVSAAGGNAYIYKCREKGITINDHTPVTELLVPDNYASTSFCIGGLDLSAGEVVLVNLRGGAYGSGKQNGSIILNISHWHTGDVYTFQTNIGGTRDGVITKEWSLTVVAVPTKEGVFTYPDYYNLDKEPTTPTVPEEPKQPTVPEIPKEPTVPEEPKQPTVPETPKKPTTPTDPVEEVVILEVPFAEQDLTNGNIVITNPNDKGIIEYSRDGIVWLEYNYESGLPLIAFNNIDKIYVRVTEGNVNSEVVEYSIDYSYLVTAPEDEKDLEEEGVENNQSLDSALVIGVIIVPMAIGGVAWKIKGRSDKAQEVENNQE